MKRIVGVLLTIFVIFTYSIVYAGSEKIYIPDECAKIESATFSTGGE